MDFFQGNGYERQILDAGSFSDIFEIVKKLAGDYLGLEQAGLMVGLADLGINPNGFVGAFYSPSSNTIILNKRPLFVMAQTRPEWYRYYVFHVMLHEYVHSLGVYDELQARQVVREICSDCFGEEHLLAKAAFDLNQFFPNVRYADQVFIPPKEMRIDFIRGIDKSNTNYIG